MSEIRHRWFYFYAGYDACRALDASFDFALLPDWERAKRNPCSLVPVMFSIRASWNWRPRLIRQYFSCPPWPNVYWSCAWTGRYSEIVGFGWLACGSISFGKRCWRFTSRERWFS